LEKLFERAQRSTENNGLNENDKTIGQRNISASEIRSRKTENSEGDVIMTSAKVSMEDAKKQGLYTYITIAAEAIINGMTRTAGTRSNDKPEVRRKCYYIKR
jgi:hypothetical protein